MTLVIRARPKVKLIGQNGNVFNLLAICSKALRKCGQAQEAKEMQRRIFKAHSYDEALEIMCEYVDAR